MSKLFRVGSLILFLILFGFLIFAILSGNDSIRDILINILFLLVLVLLIVYVGNLELKRMWLKGLIIGNLIAIYPIIFALFMQIIDSQWKACTNFWSGGDFFLPCIVAMFLALKLSILPFLNFSYLIEYGTISDRSIWTISDPLGYFLFSYLLNLNMWISVSIIGSLIGWIYGKIKQRKSVEVNN